MAIREESLLLEKEMVKRLFAYNLISFSEDVGFSKILITSHFHLLKPDPLEQIDGNLRCPKPDYPPKYSIVRRGLPLSIIVFDLRSIIKMRLWGREEVVAFNNSQQVVHLR